MDEASTGYVTKNAAHWNGQDITWGARRNDDKPTTSRWHLQAPFRHKSWTDKYGNCGRYA